MLVAIENHVAVTGGLTDTQMEFWLRSINKVSGDNAQTAVGLVHEIKKQHDAPATQSPAEGSQRQGKKKKKRWWHL